MSDSTLRKLAPDEMVLEYTRTRAADLRDAITAHYATLVERIARRFGGGSEGTDDLTQVGFIGLLNALELYDPGKGVKFATYATYLVVGEIRHHLRDRGKIIKEPAWLQELNQRINRVIVSLSQEYGRQPTAAEIGANMRMTEEAVVEIMMTRDIFKVISLDGAPDDDDNDNPYDLDKMEPREEATFHLPIEDKMLLETAVVQLKEIERRVIQLFFYDSLNQTEIAHELQISCNYVSHILRHSMQKLRKILVTEDLKDRQLRARASGEGAPRLDSADLLGPDYFVARSSEEVQRASLSGWKVAIIVVQFAGLERLRNFYGDMTVGEFLHEAAGVIRSSVRKMDVVCRAGNYAFGIILPHVETMREDIHTTIESRLCEWLTRLFSAQTDVTISVGRADYPRDDASVHNLLEQAWGGTKVPAAKAA